MKKPFQRSVDRIVKHTPESLLRVLRPTIKPLLSPFLSEDSPGTRTGAYLVRPLRPPAREGPRILHVIGNFLTGGSSRLVVDLYERLGHRYVQEVVSQVVPHPPAYENIPVTQIAARDSVEPIAAYMRQFRPDLVHVHYWGDCDTPWYDRAFEAARALGIPVIENVNTPVAPHVAPEVREYVFVSDYVRATFGQGVARQCTIYPGSDFTLFRKPWITARNGDRVGMVYRLEPDKLDVRGIEPMIEAARLDPEIRCMVVGGGTFFDAYRERVAAAGLEKRFRFTGYVPYTSLPALYCRIAVFVAPVWKESFGQVSPFAMSMGIPVVGYDVGAIGEIVDDRSLLAPPGDSAALGRIIADLMAAPRRRAQIGARNKARARQLFSVEAMIEAYDRVYTRHLERRA